MGSARGKRILRKIWNVVAPYDFARAIFARSVRRKPVTELIITIGPTARATATIRGHTVKPMRSMRRGTSAMVGVVTRRRMYGVMIFSK